MSARSITAGILGTFFLGCLLAVAVSNIDAPSSAPKAAPTKLDAKLAPPTNLHATMHAKAPAPAPATQLDTLTDQTPEKYYLTPGTEIVGSAGKIGLWIAFGCMAFPGLYFYFKATQKPVGERKFEYLSFTINAIASLAYLTMACGYGATEVNGQQFFYARYVDWTLTTPLMLLDLILLGHNENADTETICHILSVDILMIIGGLIGALQGGHHSSWVFFVFSMCFFVPIFYYLLFAPSFQEKIVEKYKSVYTQAAWITAIFWCGYPIAWVLHEGTSTIDLDTAVIIYLILDTISKSVWGFVITMGRDSVSPDHEPIPSAPK